MSKKKQVIRIFPVRDDRGWTIGFKASLPLGKKVWLFLEDAKRDIESWYPCWEIEVSENERPENEP